MKSSKPTTKTDKYPVCLTSGLHVTGKLGSEIQLAARNLPNEGVPVGVVTAKAVLGPVASFSLVLANLDGEVELIFEHPPL
jgi:hypothetical protein